MSFSFARVSEVRHMLCTEAYVFAYFLVGNVYLAKARLIPGWRLHVNIFRELNSQELIWALHSFSAQIEASLKQVSHQYREISITFSNEEEVREIGVDGSDVLTITRTDCKRDKV